MNAPHSPSPLATIEMAPKDPTAGGNPVPFDGKAALQLYRNALDGRLA